MGNQRENAEENKNFLYTPLKGGGVAWEKVVGVLIMVLSSFHMELLRIALSLPAFFF